MEIRDFIEKTLQESGELVKASFGEIVPSIKKMERSQIVTEIDVASERLIIEKIIKEYPETGIIAEESGFIESKDNSYFIIDPIDGTSNFANGLPWFGVMMAYIMKNRVMTSGIYLPVTNEMYLSERGKGAFKNGIQIKKLPPVSLKESLVSLCYDCETEEDAATVSSIVRSLSLRVLNMRTTNSACDYVYAAEGKLGATVNLQNKLWDVAPISLIAQESGCFVSDAKGKPLDLTFEKETYTKEYTLLVANPSIQEELLSLLR